MPDKSYDLVYVGAGNKNLVNAMYASKYGGLSVGMFDMRHEAGGGWCSDEIPAPGFVANQCSHIHTYLNHHAPIWEDFPEWEEYGVKVARPRLAQSSVFSEDDTWCGVYSIWEKGYRDKTYNMLKRFSEKDAETYLRFEDKFRKFIFPAALEFSFNPPPPPGEPNAMQKLIMNNPECGINPAWLQMSPIQFLEETFESPEVQTFAVCGTQSAGVNPTAPGSALAALILMMAYTDTIVIKGGTHQCAHAAQRVIYENGGKIFHGKTVEKILVENGKATGIRLADGSEIEGRLGVVCGANPIDLVHDLTDPDLWSETIQTGVKSLKRNFVCITWYTWALKEQPIYKAESFDPDIKDSCWINLTRKGLDAIASEVERRLAGEWPKLEDFHLGVANWSRFAHDYYAPPGGDKATILTEHFVLPATRYTDAEWKEIEKRHADEVISHWSKYCPNVTWDHVIGYVPVTPHYAAKHSPNYGPEGNWCIIDQDGPQFGTTRPIPELADLRNFPIENLYPCSSGWHPRGGATSQQGRWVYKVIAEKNGLTPPPKKDWTEIVQRALQIGDR